MYVYFIQCGGEKGPVKVGRSKNVSARITELQTGNPEKIELIASLVCSSEENARYLEAKFHRTFVRYRIRGEWFKHNVLRKLRGESMDELALEREVSGH